MVITNLNKVTIAAAAALSLALFSCSGSNEEKPVVEGAQPIAGITPADIASAKPVANFTLKADTLHLNYKKGETFRYKITQIKRSTNDSVEIEAVGTHVYTKRIKNIRSDGSYEIGMTIDKITLTQRAKRVSDGTILEEAKYNSDDSTNRKDERFMQNTALLGEEVTMILNRRGGIIEIFGTSTIANKILKDRTNVPADAPQQVARAVEMSVYIPFTKEEILNFPDTLRPDGSWYRAGTQPVSEVFLVTQNGTYQMGPVVEAKGQKLATVSATVGCSVSVTPSEASKLVKIEIKDSKSSGVGKLTLDAERGYTVQKSTDLTMNVVAEITDKRKGDKTTMRQSSSSSVKVELLP